MTTKLILIAVLLTTLVLMPGCSKKDPPQPPEPTQTEGSTQDAAPDTTASAIEKVKESFTMDVDLEKTVDDLKAEAAKMDVESLKEVATKYKTVITEKEAELKTLMDKLSAVPLTEKMGEEAQALTGEIKTISDAVTALQERFGVYVDALTEKGVDVKALFG
ncbi:MAG: hypothetical protein ABFR90_10475 [Planctomycetota bacterium]